MILLDTNVFSLLLFDRQATLERLIRRLESTNDSVAIPIVTVEEELRGWLAWVAKAKDLGRLVQAYGRLESTLAGVARFNVAGFDPDAANEYARLRKAYRRLGSMDLRIAAIAISLDAVLISQNLKDFGQINGLRVEDWVS